MMSKVNKMPTLNSKPLINLKSDVPKMIAATLFIAKERRSKRRKIGKFLTVTERNQRQM